MNLEFKSWLKETATSTSCVAVFARPLGMNNSFEEKPKKHKKNVDKK